VRPAPRRFGLEAKVVVLLLAIAALPLAASAILVTQVALVAQSVALGEADRLKGMLERARAAYVEALDARKDSFRHASDALGRRPEVVALCAQDPAGWRPVLQVLSDEEPDLRRVALRRGTDERAVERPAAEGARTLSLARKPAEGCELELVWASEASARLQEDLDKLGDALLQHRQIERIRRNLPPSYRTAFLFVVGGIVAVTTLTAILIARAAIRRLRRLGQATLRVAEGDLDTKVAARARNRDELDDLADAFDDMVAQLKRSRAEIEYLQKIGAWQEVARRLAHEIKNPLTPIQLAVQQLHTKYAGDDARYRRMLDDANEIVVEEVAGLRRLVDNFSSFAKLPRVEARPLDVAAVVDDAARELPSDGGPTLELEAPARPVTVAGDRLLLRRVLANLVDNAGQAGAKRVKIAWRRAGDRAHLVIDDDGPGVPETLRERVFDPYVTTKPHGTGLGLAIAKKTILEHGGSIEVSPAASPLGGARFEIQLPLSAASA
jgi:two-component system, NtrC family, nitrogen regulation sensor histidine kinase NtrY